MSHQECTDNVRGEYVVDHHSTSFGDVLEHGLNGLCLFMALPKNGGWKPLTSYRDSHDGSANSGPKSALLSHQTYRKHVETYVRQNPNTREVAVVALDSGEWKTVWARDTEYRVADSRGR